MIFRELRIATANGLTLGVLMGSGTAVAVRQSAAGCGDWAAMIINNLVAGLAGIMVPVTLDRLKIDPAVSHLPCS
jgi:magnesium transporter